MQVSRQGKNSEKSMKKVLN